jgi:DNA-binding response OmpR family regulator
MVEITLSHWLEPGRPPAGPPTKGRLTHGCEQFLSSNPPPAILVIEDDPGLRPDIVQTLESAGLGPVKSAGTAADALAQFRASPQWSVILLDLTLPDGSGLNLLREFRAASGVPVIVVSGLDNVIVREEAFTLGATDFLGKPFHPVDLIARVRSSLQRGPVTSSDQVVLDGATVDFGTGEIVRGDQTFVMTPTEYTILRTLAAQAGRIVPTNRLAVAVWGSDAYAYERPLVAHIARIRRKTELDPHHPVSLITVPGLGYRLAVRSGTA